MSKHILLTVFFFSSFSIHAMEVSCPNQDKKQADNPLASTMQLQVSNHSEHIATFFNTVGVSKLCAPRVLAPYEDSDPITVMRKGKTYINTFAGSFLLKQPKKDNPHKALILHSLKALQKDYKWSTDKVVVQKMPYEQSHNVIAIVNPSGDIELAQHHDAQEHVVKRNVAQEIKVATATKANNAISAVARQPLGSVFFIDSTMLSKSLEYIDLQKRSEQASKSGNHSELNSLSEAMHTLSKRLIKIANEIAKERGACAVFPRLHEEYYIDSACDITEEAIAELNKSYVPSNKSKMLLPQEQLYQAIINDSVDEVKSAVKNGANVNYLRSNKPEIYWSIVLQKKETSKALLECGAIVDSSYIQHALDNNDVKMAVLIAIQSNANLNALYSAKYPKKRNLEGRTLAQFAASHYAWDSILALMRNGLNVSPDMEVTKGKPLAFAALNWNHSMEDSFTLIAEFIKQGYDINKIWAESLEHGLVYRNEKVLNFMLKNGACVNHIFEQKNRQGSTWTPLLAAIKNASSSFELILNGSFSIVKILLEAGADVNKKASPLSTYNPTQPQEAQSPLSYVISQNNTAIIPLLLEYGAV